MFFIGDTKYCILHSLFLESVSYLKSTCSRIVWKVIERGRGYRNVQSLYQLAWHFHWPPMTPCIFPRISRRVGWVHALTPAHLLSSCLYSYLPCIRTMWKESARCDTGLRSIVVRWHWDHNLLNPPLRKLFE